MRSGGLWSHVQHTLPHLVMPVRARATPPLTKSLQLRRITQHQRRHATEAYRPPIENHFGRPPRRAAVRFALPPPFGLAHAGASSLRSLPSVGDEKPAVGRSKSAEGSYGAGSGAAVLRSYWSSDAT